MSPSASRFAPVAAALALVACNPVLQGECSLPDDCPEGTVCTNGLCLATGGPISGPDGGPPIGNPDAGVPALAVTITSPEPDARRAGTPLALTATVTGGAAEALQFQVVTSTGTRAALLDATAAGGTWTATLALGQATFVTGTYTLLATAFVGTEAFESAPQPLHVDKIGPSVQFTVGYPARAVGHPAANAFLRSDTVVVTAQVTDPSGVGVPAPALTVPGFATPLTGTPGVDGRWTFQFDARTPPLLALEAELTVSLATKDRLENPTVANQPVKLSRRAFVWRKARAVPVTTAPALVAAGGRRTFVVGDSDGVVSAVDRLTGALVWEHDLPSALVGHVAAGESTLYAATRDGYVYWIDPAPAATTRQVFRCPRNPLDPAEGGLVPPAGGPSIGWTLAPRGGGSPAEDEEETLFLLTSSGQLRMLRKSLFSSRVGPLEVTSCARSTSLPPGAPILTGTPVIDPLGDLYVGTPEGKVHKISVVRAPGDGSYALEQPWGGQPYDARSAVTGQLAIAAAGSPWGVLVPTSSGQLRAVHPTSQQLWSANALTQAIRGGVAADGTSAYALPQPGNGANARSQVMRYALSTGQAGTGAPVRLEARDTSAEASPVVAADGRVYAATGPRLTSLSATGEAEWSLDTRPNGAGTAVLTVDGVTPALACDGLLYVVASSTTLSEVHAIVTDSRTGLARTGWPRALHDAGNTGNAATPLDGACAH